MYDFDKSIANKRKKEKLAYNFLYDKGFTIYDHAKLKHMDELEARNYQNSTYTELILLQE